MASGIRIGSIVERLLTGPLSLKFQRDAMLTLQKPARHGEPWTPDEDAKLRTLASTHTRAAIAKILSRSVGSIEGRALVLGLKMSYRIAKMDSSPAASTSRKRPLPTER